MSNRAMMKSSKEVKYIKHLYAFLFAMLLVNPLLGSFISNTTILRSMELLCFIMVIAMVYKLYKCKCLKSFHSYEKILYGILGFISISIIIRGNWPNTPSDFLLHFITATPVYLLPFIIVPLPNKKYFVDILKLFYKLSLFVIPLWIINASDVVQEHFKAEGIGSYLPFISAFLLGLYSYFNKRQKILNITLWAIYLIFMMLNGRRNISFSLVMYACIAYIFYITTDIKKNKFRFVIVMLISILFLFVLLLSVDSLASGTFKYMANRMNEDSRSGVEELFFADFANSPISDWIFGRGIDGGYYQIMQNNETNEITYSRLGIETGYLHYILKGGIVYAVVIVLIILLAIKRGYAHNNKIDSFITTILCTYLIDLYTTNPVSIFYVRSILFWFCISIVSEQKIHKVIQKS